MPMLGGTPMRRLFALASVLLLTACGSDNPGGPPDLTSAQYVLESVDGLAYGTEPITETRGTLTLAGGTFSESAQLRTTRFDWGPVLVDSGTYVVRGDSIELRSTRQGNIRGRGLVRGNQMTVLGGVLTYHWRKQ